jgi:triacylglycerol lipase
MPRAAKLRNPIILVHGLMGFDAVRFLRMRLCGYFVGIEESLRSADNRVYVARLSPTQGIAHRAEELKTFVDRVSPTEPVHVVAHSMGGLDARYMISRLDMAARVLSLTTIGTPHRGSPFADWGTRRLGPLFIPPLLRLGIPHAAFFDLRSDACDEFNAKTPDAPGVRYFSVAGQCSLAWLGPQWLLTYNVVRFADGANDGLVSVRSATWGEHTDVWDGDHLSLINWPNPQALALGAWRCRRPQYAALVRRLADLGF